MFRQLKAMLGVYPSTSEALHNYTDACVKTADQVYVVRDNTGQVEALKQEILAMRKRGTKEELLQRNTTSLLSVLNSDTTPFPKNLFFSNTGHVQIMGLSYNHDQTHILE